MGRKSYLFSPLHRRLHFISIGNVYFSNSFTPPFPPGSPAGWIPGLPTLDSTHRKYHRSSESYFHGDKFWSNNIQMTVSPFKTHLSLVYYGISANCCNIISCLSDFQKKSKIKVTRMHFSTDIIFSSSKTSCPAKLGNICDLLLTCCMQKWKIWKCIQNLPRLFYFVINM